MCPCHNTTRAALISCWIGGHKPRSRNESIFLPSSYWWDGMIYWSDNEKRNLLCEDYVWRLFPLPHMHTSNTYTQMNVLHIKCVPGEWSEWVKRRKEKEKFMKWTEQKNRAKISSSLHLKPSTWSWVDYCNNWTFCKGSMDVAGYYVVCQSWKISCKCAIFFTVLVLYVSIQMLSKWEFLSHFIYWKCQ